MDAFGAKLGPILGSDARARRFVASVLRPAHAVAALDGDGALLGVAGYHDERGGFVGGGLPDITRAYGVFGGVWRGLALSVFEREPADGQLLMDGVVVARPARGCGVGAALIERIVALAAETGRREVRLDVIDVNPRARALYERMGFVAGKTSSAGFLRPFFGFSSATTMIRGVSPTNAV